MSPGSAAALDDADAMAIVNAERASIGVTPFSQFDSTMADGCRKHSTYVSLNADNASHVHDELPGRPGYTPEGQLAAQRSNLGGAWDEVNRRNPYAFGAPWHEMKLLSPVAGDTFWRGVGPGGSECMGAGGSLTPVPTEAIWPYPGNGATNVPIGQTMAGEGPYSPVDFLGLPSDTVTGPNIYLFGGAGGGRCVSPVLAATLRGPDGRSVPYWQIDRASVGPTGRVPLVAGGMLILPKETLQPSTVYTYSGTVSRQEATCASGGGSANQVAIGPVSFSTSFTTAGTAAVTPGTQGGDRTPDGGSSVPSKDQQRTQPPKPITLIAGRLAISALSLTPSRVGSCPKSARVEVKSRRSRTTQRLKVSQVSGGCRMTGTLKLHGKLAKAGKVTVVITGKGLKSKRKTVTAT